MKRARTWLGQNMVTGQMNGTESPTNSLGCPLEPASSRITIQTYQVPLRAGLVSGDRLVLTYNEGTMVPPGTSPTVIDLVGVNVLLQSCQLDSLTGEMRKNYSLGYDTVGGAPATARIDVCVSQLNSVDLVTNGGEALDFQLHLWVDETHETAQLADPKEIFHDQFITRLTELDPSQIRTGPNWSENNTAGSLVGGWTPDWSTRRTPNTLNWSTGGEIPWEAHCWLANKMQSDLWVCIPLITFRPNAEVGDPDYDDYARAETYTRELAKLIKSELDIQRHCVVEWSNEIWNSSFTTFQWLQDLVELEVGEGNANVQLMAQKAADIEDLIFSWWLDEWNDCRVEIAVMGHAPNTVWVDTIGTQLALSNMVDAVGCTVYMQPDKNSENDWRTGTIALPNNSTGYALVQSATELSLDRDDGVSGNTSFIRAHGTSADTIEGCRADGQKVDFYIYESGPHFTVPFTGINPDDPPEICDAKVRDVYTGMQNTAEMAELINHYLYRFLLPYDAVTNTYGVDENNPLPRLVDRMTYFAFCQNKNVNFGRFYLLEDLFADLGPGFSIVHQQTQYKFSTVVAFVPSWIAS